MNRGDILDPRRQSECESYRIVLPRQNGTEVLMVSAADRFVLPTLEVPRWQRAAECLSTAMRTQWGWDAICLFSPDTTLAPGVSNEIRYQVMQCNDQTLAQNARAEWRPVASLSQNCFVDPSDYLAVRQSLAAWDAYLQGSAPGPFAKPGWFEQLRLWVEEVIQPLGFHMTGAFRQVNASPSFSLIRFETDGPAIWFKAVGEPNVREFPITIALAQLFPKYIAPILATRPGWNGWLAQEIEGSTIAECQASEPWKAAVTALANLQIDSIGTAAQLLTAGARNLSAAALSNLLQPFLGVMAQLMEEQRKVPPVVLTRQELLLLGEQIQGALSLAGELGIPNTIGHLDLNPNNIIVSSDGCKFLDWAEAYVGEPFFSAEYLREHFRRSFGPNPALEAQLIAAYVEPWRTLLPTDDIVTVLSLAPLIAAFAYATGNDVWSDPEKLKRPGTAGYLRSLTRRMKHEADRRKDWRSRWLS